MYQKRNKGLGILTLYLRDYTKQFYLREISKLTKIPLKTTQNLILDLEEKKILKSILRGKNKYFRLNLDNIETKFYLLQSEIYRSLLFLKKYPLFKSFLREINTNKPLVIFGSFAKFKADKDSDLDLLVFSDEKLPLHLLPYELHKIKLTEPSFVKLLEKKEPLMEELKENHVILNNPSFYVNIMWSYYGR
ncbi:MAG: nucleotidyltransferase domain-containing protein [Nanoarchaeota archaeon]|nr:nucleotidyltransferase domain-containing protein [Nanoarchaeota archaeon]